MAKKAKRKGPPAVAVNRKARHTYFIEEVIESGIALTGPEVRSLRAGHVSIGEAFAADKDGEFYLMNAHISPYAAASHIAHDPYRPRKLLLHRREIARMLGQRQRAGVTMVPMSIYFNERGIAKVGLGIAKGKKQFDKRQTDKERDWRRAKERLIRDKG